MLTFLSESILVIFAKWTTHLKGFQVRCPNTQKLCFFLRCPNTLSLQMASPFSSPEDFTLEDWLETLANIFAAVHNTFLLIFHIYHLYPRETAEFVTKQHRKLGNIQILSIFAIAVPIVYNLMIGLNPWLTWLRTSSTACLIWIKLTVFLYGFNKVIIYSVLIERLFVVFRDSHYSFRRSTILMIRTLILLVFVLLSAATNILSGSKFDSSTGRCIWDPPKWIFLMVAASLAVIEVTISIMFSRRLLLLNMNKSSHSSLSRISISYTTNHNQRDSQSMPSAPRLRGKDSIDTMDTTWTVLLKASILTFIALSSMFLSLLLGFLVEFTGFWAAIDSMVCSWMVMLMFSKHGRIYSLCCGRLEPCVSRRCLYLYTCHCCTDLMEKESSVEPTEGEAKTDKPKRPPPVKMMSVAEGTRASTTINITPFPANTMTPATAQMADTPAMAVVVMTPSFEIDSEDSYEKVAV